MGRSGDHLDIEMRPRRSGNRVLPAREEKLRKRSLKEQLWHGWHGCVFVFLLCSSMSTLDSDKNIFEAVGEDHLVANSSHLFLISQP